MLYLCRCNPFNGIPTMVHEPNSKFNRNVRKYNCRTTNRVKMTRLITIEQLLAKPICMMTGEELTLLLQNTEKVTAKVPAEVVPEKHYEYGIEGLAKVFKCSIPTANRIKKVQFTYFRDLSVFEVLCYLLATCNSFFTP